MGGRCAARGGCRAAGPGGMRCLRRCGAAVVDAAIAARSRAATWPASRTVAPAPGLARRWRAMTIPLLVAMSMLRGAEPVRDGDRGAGQLGWHRVVVAAEGDQRLRGGCAGDGEHGGERRRERGEGLGGGDGGHGGPAVAGGA